MCSTGQGNAYRSCHILQWSQSKVPALSAGRSLLSPEKYSLLPDTVEAGELLHRKGPQLQGREEMVTATEIGNERKEGKD